jgi:protein O-mannosyl-transferase
MAKKKRTNSTPVAEQKPKAVAEEIIGVEVPAKPLSIYDFKVQAVIVGLLALIFYFNTVFNEYAHDDGITIIKNEYVQTGFAGIPSIFTKDAYDSYYRQLNTINQLSGGRYRPLSIVTFAIEQQFMGPISEDKIDSVLKERIAYGIRGDAEKKLINEMHVRHVVNVLFYILSVVVILYFLRYVVFKHSPITALVAAILFTIHPIHTEVVANVKSRDEIMSLMFMCITFIYEFRYRELKKPWMLGAALISLFFAFLSKEYAITMVFLLPMSLIVFKRYSFQNSIVAFLPYCAVIAVYMVLRFRTVAPPGANSDTEVLNNPYLFASGMEKIATEIATSLNYLKLLIFPHPLSADYSYDSIPYKDFGSPLVWLSVVVHIGLVVVMLKYFFRFLNRSNSPEVMGVKATSERSLDIEGVISFAIAFYLLHLMLVCNIFFDIGATMGERLIYHSSLGFAIAVAYLLVKGFKKIQPVAVSQKALAAFVGVVIVLSGFKTIQRNAAWKNDGTLFVADLKTVPNSVLVCANVAAHYIADADNKKTQQEKNVELNEALKLLDHALSIHPNMVASYMNRGIAYYKMGEIDKAKANLDSVKRRYPNYPTLQGVYKLIGEDYMKKGWDSYGKFGKYPEAINEFIKGITIDSSNSALWYNLGGAYYSNHQFAEAIGAWTISLRLKPNPNYDKAVQGMKVAKYLLDSLNRKAPVK